MYSLGPLYDAFVRPVSVARNRPAVSLYARLIKPAGDRVCAALALAALSPLFAVLAWLIRREDGGPVFFRQERPGKDHVLFEVVKFRTMPVGVDQLPSADASSLPVTRIGRFMRRWSLDEWPQLINIVRGEMSFVGPRPPMPSQHTLLSCRLQNGASRLRPGLTGWAQVHGTEGMPEEEKAVWDGEYVHRIGPLTDLRIIGRTLRYLAKPPPRV
jgi:lipopolysaccharide/colanic/teichoic acid biosynthesis glycosyltransferase